MSCELNFISIFLLLALILELCHCFSARSELEGASYVEERDVNRELFKFTNKTAALTQPQSDTIQSDPINQNRNVSADSLVVENNEKLHFEKTKHSYEVPPNDDESEFEQTPGAFDLTGFQSDSPGSESGVQGIAGKVIYGTKRGSKLTNVPLVHCSEQVMTLTVAGREHPNIFVDRGENNDLTQADAAPLPLLHVPAYCGISVAFTWKDLILTIPYDGCFIAQENGSYVLSLLWWGSPIKLSCPMKPGISSSSLSFVCSRFGVVIYIQGALDAHGKHQIKVNGNLQALVSDRCAYRMQSPPETVLLHVAFNAECWAVMDDERVLVIFMDGKKFTVSCQSSRHQSGFLPYFQPVKPDVDKALPFPQVSSYPASVKATRLTVNPQQPYEQPPMPQFQNSNSQYPFHPRPKVHQQQKPSGHFYPHHPVQQIPLYPMIPPSNYLPYPMSCPPYPKEFCSQYSLPDHNPFYQEPVTPTQSLPAFKPDPWVPFTPPTYNPPPLSVFEETEIGQRPIFSQTPPAETSKTSSLNCARNRLTATLPSARLDSFKVKDLEANTWILVASVSERCDYKLYHKDGYLVFSSPLPACHTAQTSSTIISLFIRFWDSSKERYRTLQLQCHFYDEKSTQSPLPLAPAKPFQQAIPNLTDVPPKKRSKFDVLCSSQHMTVKLPHRASELFVQDPHNEAEAVPILEAPSYCGYSVKVDKDEPILVVIPYSSCHMRQKDGQHQIILKYRSPRGRSVESLLSCQAALSQECNVAHMERLSCGSGLLSSSECHRRGCCYCVETQSCYYPMDECTMDRHLVFSVRSSSMDPPLTPATLITAGNSSCTPEVATDDVALFKIPLDECGVHRYEVGKTVIYMVEILNRMQPITLNYGTITRESPVRLVVECRYLPGSLVSVGYLVKSPSLGPTIRAQGVFGVQLRIAKDENYKKFYPQYHQPLRMLLGKPLYLEVRLLNPPDPSALLLVHYCVAYPRSANSAWILIYDGCPNFLDKTPTHTFHTIFPESPSKHVRRFTITTFQFLSDDGSLEENEEIYFMCSTEVCLPSEGPCVEGCFTGTSDGMS